MKVHNLFEEIITEYNALCQNDIIPKYAFNAKELDEELRSNREYNNINNKYHEQTGMYYYEARYYNPPTFISRDPLFEKYPSISPYAYCANNPVLFVDPTGKEFGDYYDENGIWIANDGINDNRVYQANPDGDVTFGLGMLKQTQFDYVGDVDEVKMTFTGDMVANSEKAQGQLNVIQVVGDKEFTRSSYDAVSGSRTLYSLENGNYESNNFRDRTTSAMVKDGVGFSIDLNPTFTTERSLLRIHPDGNLPGTEGCIGLTGGEGALNSFINLVRPIYDSGNNINVNVDIDNNPNHNQPRRK